MESGLVVKISHLLWPGSLAIILNVMLCLHVHVDIQIVHVSRLLEHRAATVVVETASTAVRHLVDLHILLKASSWTHLAAIDLAHVCGRRWTCSASISVA